MPPDTLHFSSFEHSVDLPRAQLAISGTRAGATKLQQTVEFTASIRRFIVRPPRTCRLTKSVLVNVSQLQDPSPFREVAWFANWLGLFRQIGNPRDLAEERWILELADIYENAFSE